MAYRVIQCIHGRFRELWKMRPNQGLLCFKPLQTWVSLKHSPWRTLKNSTVYWWLSVTGNVCLLSRPIRQLQRPQEITSPFHQLFDSISYGGTQFLLLQPLRLKCPTWWQTVRWFWHSLVMKISHSWHWKRDNKEIQPYFSEKTRVFPQAPEIGRRGTNSRQIFLAYVESSLLPKKNGLYLWKSFPARAAEDMETGQSSDWIALRFITGTMVQLD